MYLQILKEKNLEEVDAFPSKSRIFISVVVKDGVRLIFQSSLKTLSDAEIHNSVDNSLKPMIELDNVAIPGF